MSQSNVSQSNVITLTQLNEMEKRIIDKINDVKKELKGLIEVQQKLIHVQLNAPIPPAPKEYGEETSTKIQITNFSSDKIKVSGKTYDYMAVIKDSGSAKFDKETKCWVLPIDSLDVLTEKLQAAKLVLNKDFSVNVIKTEGSGFGE